MDDTQHIPVLDISDPAYNTQRADHKPCHECNKEIEELWIDEKPDGSKFSNPLRDRSNRIDCEIPIEGKYFTNRDGVKEQRSHLVTYHTRCYKRLMNRYY